MSGKVGRRASLIIALILAMTASVSLMRCTSGAAAAGLSQAVVFSPNQAPFKFLSEYHFFTDGPNQVPNEGVIPYDLVTPLFTDYASKSRFVWMPEGKSATWSDSGVFDFPVGSVLIKTFFYEEELSSAEPESRLMETRLLMRRTEGWDAYPYVWLPDQRDAVLKVAGASKEVVWGHPDGELLEFDYIVPNKNQCKGCHTIETAFSPIGPKARNLNREFDYESGTANQLDHWQSVGYLTGLPEVDLRPTLTRWNDQSAPVRERALAYLEVNCGHCHSPDGPANTSGLHLTTTESDRAHLGYCKSPVAAGRGSGGFSYDIYPGKADSSILVYRMKSDDPAIRMPELGRQLEHREGVRLIEDWINGEEGGCGPAAGL